MSINPKSMQKSEIECKISVRHFVCVSIHTPCGRVRLARFTLEDHAYGASRLPKTTVLQSTSSEEANVRQHPGEVNKEFQSSFNFCRPLCLSEFKVRAVNHFNFTFCTQLHFFALNFTFLYSISLFCTDLGLIDMFLTNHNACRNCCLCIIRK